MVKETRTPLVKGSHDPDVIGCILVPARRKPRSFPTVSEEIADMTFFRYHERRRRIVCLVSRTADGVNIGWDTCGTCFTYFTRCTCRVLAPSQHLIRLVLSPGGLLGMPTAHGATAAGNGRRTEHAQSVAPRRTTMSRAKRRPDLSSVQVVMSAEVTKAAAATSGRMTAAAMKRLKVSA